MAPLQRDDSPARRALPIKMLCPVPKRSGPLRFMIPLNRTSVAVRPTLPFINWVRSVVDEPIMIGEAILFRILNPDAVTRAVDGIRDGEEVQVRIRPAHSIGDRDVEIPEAVTGRLGAAPDRRLDALNGDLVLVDEAFRGTFFGEG